MKDFISIERRIIASLDSIKEDMLAECSMLAKRNLPRLVGDNITLTFDKYHRRYQKLLESLNQEVQVNTTLGALHQSEANIQAALGETNAQSIILEQRYLGLKARLAELKPCWQVRWWWVLLVVLTFFALGDAFLNAKVAEAWGFTALESLVIGTILSSLFLFFGHITPRMIALGRSRRGQVAISLTIFTAAVTLFYLLGKARADYLTALAHREGASIDYSPIPFLIISLLFFIVAVMTFLFKPTQQMVEDRFKYKAVIREKKGLEAQLNKLADEKKQLLKVAGTNRIETASDLEASASLERKIIETAHEHLSLFKSQNLLLRPDGGMPDCFEQQYPFAFTTYFSSFSKTLRA